MLVAHKQEGLVKEGGKGRARGKTAYCGKKLHAQRKGYAETKVPRRARAGRD